MLIDSKYTAQILKDLPIGLLIFNSNTKVSFVNTKALEILQCDLKDIKGLTAKELGNDFSLTQVVENLVLAKGLIIGIKNKTGNLKIKIETQVLGKDFLVFLQNTEKEQELENLQLQTHTILNSLNNLILLLDTTNNIVMCNKAFSNTIEMDIEDILGMSFQKLNEITQISEKEMLENIIKDSEPSTIYEASIITMKGEKKQLLIHAAPVYNIEKDRIGTIFVATDITSLKLEQQRLQQNEKLILLGQMAQGIVHEIRNPLTAVKGFSQMIIKKSKENMIKEFAQYIENEANNLNKIVSDFLTFAQPKTPTFRNISLNKIVKEMKMILEANTFMKGIKVDYELGTNLNLVKADKNQIKQVILNIIKNAIDAMEDVEYPQIILGTSYNETTKESCIKIFNNGKPMSEEEKKMVATPFFTTKDTGTGLGLSISYQIMKEHQGRIDIESKEEIGTSFMLFFPVI